MLVCSILQPVARTLLMCSNQSALSSIVQEGVRVQEVGLYILRGDHVYASSPSLLLQQPRVNVCKVLHVAFRVTDAAVRVLCPLKQRHPALHLAGMHAARDLCSRLCQDESVKRCASYGTLP